MMGGRSGGPCGRRHDRRFVVLCKCPRRQLRREGLISFAAIHRIGAPFARHVLHLRDGRRPLLRWRRRMRGCAPTPPLALARPAYALARIISTSFYYTLHARASTHAAHRTRPISTSGAAPPGPAGHAARPQGTLSSVSLPSSSHAPRRARTLSLRAPLYRHRHRRL